MALAAVIIAFATALPVGADPDTVVRDAAIAASLTAGARDALALGFNLEAVELLDEALSYAPAHADSNYLRALVGLSEGDSPSAALSRLQTALAAGDFLLFRPADAKLLYASMLVRTRRSGEALRQIAGQARSSELIYIESVARRLSGDEAGARAVVMESLRRYPADPRSLIAYLRSSDRPFSTIGDAAIVEAGFDALDVLKEIDPGVLVAMAPYAPSLDRSRLLIREFRANGGSSADATVLALRYGLIPEGKAIGEMFSASYTPTVRSVLELHALLSSDESRAAFKRDFHAFSGVIVMDDDRDGFAESKTAYSQGQPARWALDSDQDGIPEMEAVLADGVPVSITAVSGSTNVFIQYAPWPYAGGVEFSDGDGSRRYSVGPAILAMPLVDLKRLGGTAGGAGAEYLVERSGRPLPAEKALASVAFAAERIADGGSRTSEMLGGELARSWWSDADGRSGYMTYGRGLPADEAIDADGDGRQESRRAWTRSPDGTVVPAYIEVDFDGDGVYEYRETLGTHLVKSWDYDGDGSVDMTLESSDDGSSLYRFISPGPSVRVTTAVYKNGSIESVAENGTPLPLVADSGGAVTWIGRKLFDFGAAVPPPGYGFRDEYRYRVVDLAGKLYAQIVD